MKKSFSNSQIESSLNHIARKMPGADPNNPVASLTPEEITYLQTYLEHIKMSKIQRSNQSNQQYVGPKQINQPYIDRKVLEQGAQSPYPGWYPNDRRVPVPSGNGPENTRPDKKSNGEVYNPYSYGANQYNLGSIYKPTYTGPYSTQPDLLSEMGIPDSDYWEKFPGAVRNINVESSLLQKEMTHYPGQRELTSTEINRFQMLPFDPQDTRHIVWNDNMPRNGYPTRTDRLETY